MRILTIFAVILFLALSAGSALAQSPPAVELPNPGPNQRVYTGEVPAPAGTTVTLEYLDAIALEPIVCATAATTPSGPPQSGRSRFVLIVERECAARGQSPRVCWGEDACALLPLDDPRQPAIGFDGGQTVDLGRLEVRPREIIVPDVGNGITPDGRSSYAWLFWAGIAALGGGLALGAGAFGLRRVRR